jgi:hypothetical protein
MQEIIPGHRYELANHEGVAPPQQLQFIQKEPGENPGELVTIRDGTTNEEVLRMLIHRLKFLQNAFPCRENAIVITHLETGLLWLEERTKNRVARGVEGKQVA